MPILDIGCGNAKEHGAIGIDSNPTTQADIIHDLNIFPWPLEDSHFDRIICRHVVEHVNDMIKFMEETHRIAKPGAIIEIVTPHFSNRYSFTDPTHIRHLAWRSFDYFTGEASRSTPTLWERIWEIRHPVPGFYTQTRFCHRHRFLDFGRPFRWSGIQWLANHQPDLYEAYLAFIFPARDLYITLEVIK